MSDTVLLEIRDDGVGVMTLNRPESLNSMNREMLVRLPEAAREAAENPAIRALVVTGAGRAFSAGGDMKGGSRPEFQPTPEQQKLTLRDFEEASRLLYEMKKPTIAAVNGPAFGAGFSLAMAADIRIASDAARFGTAFAKVAFSGDFGGSWFLQRLVGPALAKEMYLLAEPIDVQRAYDLHIVSQIVSADALMPESLALAARLAAGPTRIYGLMKENFRYGATSTLADLLTREAENMAIAGATSDHKEAVQAFIEKRQPTFNGE